MNLRLIQIGKTKDNWLREAIAEYQKRLRPLINFSIQELPDTSIVKAGSAEKVKASEAATCLKQIAPDEYVVLLDERGEQKTSLEFSVFLSILSDRKSVVFVIGGVYGLDEALRQRADAILSLSPLTFTHQMARLILIEQVYRALMIQNNRQYHY